MGRLKVKALQELYVDILIKDKYLSMMMMGMRCTMAC